MKHSVAPQSRKAILLAFFCAVCNVMGVRIALRFGRNTLLLIARAKANLLGRGKNPGRSWISLTLLPLHFSSLGLSSSSNRGRHFGSLLGIGVISLLGPRPEEQFSYLPHEWLVQAFSWDRSIECVPGLCKDGKGLCVILYL
jgi:hypothetical protein